MQVGAFIKITNAGPSWTGRLGCIIGKTRKRDFPWKVSLEPEAGDNGMVTIVTVREDQLALHMP